MIPDTRIMRVLVADDDREVGTSVAATLRREGYEVDLAVGGREALDWLAAKREMLIRILRSGVRAVVTADSVTLEKRLSRVPVGVGVKR